MVRALTSVAAFILATIPLSFQAVVSSQGSSGPVSSSYPEPSSWQPVPSPSSSAVAPANSTVSCGGMSILVENNCPQTLIVKVYYDNAGWNGWNWTYHGEDQISPGIRVPGSGDTTYPPGARFPLGGTFAWGSWYIVQGLVPDGCRGGANNTFAQYRFYNGACDVMHFGDDNDCQFHSR